MSLGLYFVETPTNASVLQGWNHTFRCKGTGFHFIIDWEINGIPAYKFPEDSNLKVVHVDFVVYNDGCMQEMIMTVHAESAPENNTLSTFEIRCLLRKTFSPPVVAKAYLKVHGK